MHVRSLPLVAVLAAGITTAACRSGEEPASSATPAAPAATSQVSSAPASAPPVDRAEPAASGGAAQRPTSELGKKMQANLAIARAGRLHSDIVILDSALAEYAINNAGRYPDTLEPLITPDVNGMSYLRMKEIPKDPWGREYRYEPPSPGTPAPRVFTLGRDGVSGGSGEDADVDSNSFREESPR